MELRKEAYGPHGDPQKYLSLAELDAGRDGLPQAPTDSGRLDEICLRLPDGRRETPHEAYLSVEDGLIGDGWARRPPRDPQAQITVINTRVADLVGNGQSRTLFGDNLFLDLDLSTLNLPAGTELALGDSRLVVTPEPHNGCAKFHQRFGADALRFVQNSATRHLNLRGIHFRVIRSGAIATGMSIQVVSRPAASPG